MPWRGPQYPGEFPTLGYQVAEVIEAKCAIPDREPAGEPLRLIDDQLRFLLWLYRIDPETGRFYHERGGLLVRPQKAYKSPFGAALICAEAHPEAPVRPAGWDARGEPVGKPWATPWIQVTGVSEDAAGNVWKALIPMIEMGALAADMPDTGLTRINLPGGGWIEPVTARALSRLGARVILVVQDQLESWTKPNGGQDLADAQWRNLAGTGGRFLGLANAWSPAENSVAQQIVESGAPGVYVDDVEPGSGSIRNKRERRRMLHRVYGDSVLNPRTGTGWVDLDRIEAEIEALVLRGEDAQAERWFLNRKLADADAAFDPVQWAKLADPIRIVPDRALVTIGVDGARFDDALAIVGTDVQQGHQFLIGCWERPENAADDYEHPRDEVDGALAEAFESFDVWRCYCDPQYIEHLVDIWQGRYGDRRVISWYTNRPKQVAHALRNYRGAMKGGDLSHDGDATFARHIRNARRKKLPVYDEDHRPMWKIEKDRPMSPNKIDAAMAGCLSWEARSDAVAAGATASTDTLAGFF